MPIPNEGLLLLIGEFTYRFSRFERYVVDMYPLRKRDIPYPNWDAYREQISPKLGTTSLEEYPELTKPLERRMYIPNDPDSDVEWRRQDNLMQSESIFHLILKVAQVRNNVFHGSKGLHDDKRDIDLIRESIQLLKYLENIDHEYSKYL